MWVSGQEKRYIIDVSDDEYYKVNYLLSDEDSEIIGYSISICEVAEEAIEEHGVIPQNSAWLDKGGGQTYIVKDPIPELRSEDDEGHPCDFLTEPQVYVDCPDTDSEHTWVPRERFHNDDLKLVEWQL